MLLSLLGGTLASAQILDWEAAIGEVGGGRSTFTSVVARTGVGGTQSPGALSAGFFDGGFNIGPVALNNPNGIDGVVVRFDIDPAAGTGWNATWGLQILSTNGQSRIRDITVDEAGRFFVTGIFDGDINFGSAGISLQSPGVPSGFVAWGNADDGIWLSAFETPGLLPESIAVGEGPAPDIYLTGDGALARSYTETGTLNWNEPTPPGLGLFTDIALFSAPGVPDLYVLGEDNGTNTVALYQLDRGSGAPNWDRRMGSPGNDVAGGLAVPFDGDPRVAFTVQNPSADFNGVPLPGLPPFGGTHALLLRVSVAGDLVWHTPLGLAQNAGDEMKPVDVAIDGFGNAFTAAAFQGTFLIEPPNLQVGTNDAAILGVDAAGVLFDFHRSTGAALESPNGVAAPVRDLLVTVGQYENGPSNWGPANLPPLNAGDQRAFFSVASPVGRQERFIVRPNPAQIPPPTVAEISNIINQLGGQITNVITFANGGIAVAAFLGDDAITQIGADPALQLEPDIEIRPAGTNSDAGWALKHLNDATSSGSPPHSFSYPEPGQTVNVYLLDTAIDNSSGFFTPNTNLTLEATTLVRGVGDPLVSSLFAHGTQMLSLVGGPDTGAALGVPITLKNFDFYPTGAVTTASLLAQAVYDAIDYQDEFGDCNPGLIILPSSSTTAGPSLTISDAIDEAIAAGIPVVVSAGNLNAPAANYTPADQGPVDGVMCVGASTTKRTKESNSNLGSAVDFYAPGDAVRVIDYAAPLGGSYGSFIGTSASAALTGAVAAHYLSVNPWTTPADLENAIDGDLSTGGAVDVVQLDPSGPAFYLDYDDWASFYTLANDPHDADDDGDGWSNLQEYVFGLCPDTFDPKGSQISISHNNSTNDVTVSFNISSVLLDPDKLGTLRDGGTYKVTSDGALTSFSATGESLTLGSSTGGQTALSQTATASDPECFFRVELTPASPSP